LREPIGAESAILARKGPILSFVGDCIILLASSIKSTSAKLMGVHDPGDERFDPESPLGFFSDLISKARKVSDHNIVRLLHTENLIQRNFNRQLIDLD
jgi:hypothetical protein